MELYKYHQSVSIIRSDQLYELPVLFLIKSIIKQVNNNHADQTLNSLYKFYVLNMEFKRPNFLILAFLLITCLTLANSIKTIKSFQQLGQHHCAQFPIENLWRVASGMVSQKYGEKYFDYDCYVRQFVRTDGLVIEENINDQEEQESEEQQNNDAEKKLVVDPIVTEYSLGLKKCLPQGVNHEEATYAIWRFFRYLVQHDYVYQWMRAKVRATLGYEAQRPNSWMDGQNSAPRLRLDKLFSNQFYDYVDTLMFKDFLFPLLTFFKENTVIAIGAKAAEGGKPLLFQSLQTKNFLPKIFEPVIFNLPSSKNAIFSYTLPGIPLLIGGSSSSIAWSFTGVLVDRSNIQEIETVGNKFYHHDTEEWLKLNSQQIQIPGTNGKTCKFMHSAYGPLYTKLDRQGKNQQYIMRWHEKQSKVRLIFSQLYNLINHSGNLDKQSSIEFPFNSLVVVNETGIYQYVCQQFYPSYFLYPDMFGEPEKISDRWFSYPSKKIVVVSNSHLTTTKQQAYDKGEPLSPIDQQILSQFKGKSSTKFTPKLLIEFADSIQTTSQLKKQKEMMVRIYRKVKFLYIPDEVHRKRCDQLVSMLEKWNNNLNDQKLAPIYILWNYFLRQYTFNYVSASQFGGHIAKHRVLTDNYWTGQMALWEKGTSYGQCDSYEYDQMKHEVNGTGHNSSCYLNIIRAFNKTKDILTQKYNGDYSKINLEDFTEKKYFDNIDSNFKGDHQQQAFGVFYSQNLKFAAQIGNPNIIYYESYSQQQKEVSLSQPSVISDSPQQEL